MSKFRKREREEGDCGGKSRPKKKFVDRTPYNFAAYASGTTNLTSHHNAIYIGAPTDDADAEYDAEAERLFGRPNARPLIIPQPTAPRPSPSALPTPRIAPPANKPRGTATLVLPPDRVYAAEVRRWAEATFATCTAKLVAAKRHAQTARAENLVFALNGPSGSGKRALVDDLCRQLSTNIEALFQMRVHTRCWEYRPHEDALNPTHLLHSLVEEEYALRAPDPHALSRSFKSPAELARYLNSPAARQQNTTSPIRALLVLPDLDLLFDLLDTYGKSAEDEEALVAALCALMAVKGVVVFVTTASRNSYSLRQLLKRCAHLMPHKTCYDFPLPEARARVAWWRALLGNEGAWRRFQQRCVRCGWEHLRERPRALAALALLEGGRLADADLALPNTMSQWLCELNWRAAHSIPPTTGGAVGASARAFSYDYFARHALQQLTLFAQEACCDRTEWLTKRRDWWETVLANMALSTALGQMYHGLVRSAPNHDGRLAAVADAMATTDVMAGALWRDGATLVEFSTHIADLAMKACIGARRYASALASRQPLYLAWTTSMERGRPASAQDRRAWLQDVRDTCASPYASSPSFADWCEFADHQPEVLRRSPAITLPETVCE